MRKIYKYPLEIEDRQEIAMPEGAKLLSVHMQGPNRPQLWALVNPIAQSHLRLVRCFGTGHEIDEAEIAGLQYLGTVLVHGGSLVFHYYG